MKKIVTDKYTIGLLLSICNINEVSKNVEFVRLSISDHSTVVIFNYVDASMQATRITTTEYVKRTY